MWLISDLDGFVGKAQRLLIEPRHAQLYLWVENGQGGISVSRGATELARLSDIPDGFHLQVRQWSRTSPTHAPSPIDLRYEGGSWSIKGTKWKKEGPELSLDLASMSLFTTLIPMTVAAQTVKAA